MLLILILLSNYRSGRNIFGTKPRSGYVDAYTMDGVQTIPKDEAMVFNRIEDANVTSDLMNKGGYETGNWFESQPRYFYANKVKTANTFGDNMTFLNPSDSRRTITGYMDEGAFDAFNVGKSTDVAKDMSGGSGLSLVDSEMVFPPDLTNMMRDQGRGTFFKTTYGDKQQTLDNLYDMYYNKPRFKQGGTITSHQSFSDAWKGLTEAAEDASEAVTDAYDYTSDKVSDAYDYTSDKVSDAYDYTSDKVSDAYDYTSDKVSDVGEYITDEAEDLWESSYPGQASQEFKELQTSEAQQDIGKIIMSDPSLTLQEALDKAGYDKSAYLMDYTQYAPFGEKIHTRRCKRILSFKEPHWARTYGRPLVQS